MKRFNPLGLLCLIAVAAGLTFGAMSSRSTAQQSSDDQEQETAQPAQNAAQPAQNAAQSEQEDSQTSQTSQTEAQPRSSANQQQGAQRDPRQRSVAPGRQGGSANRLDNRTGGQTDRRIEQQLPDPPGTDPFDAENDAGINQRTPTRPDRQLNRTPGQRNQQQGNINRQPDPFSERDDPFSEREDQRDPLRDRRNQFDDRFNQEDDPNDRRENNRFDQQRDRFNQSDDPFDRPDERDSQDDRFNRRENQFDRPGDDPRNQRDDRFDRPGEDQFDQRDDRFNQNDDRFDRSDQRQPEDRDQSDRPMDRDQPDGRQGRSATDINVELGATVRANAQNQLVVSNLASSGILVDSGIRQGDVIVSVDGRSVSSQVQLQQMIVQAGPQARIPLVVMRNGQRQTIYVEGRSFGVQGTADVDIGVDFRTDPQGRIVVADLASSGLLANSNLRRGDVLVEVDGRPIASHREFIRIIRYYDGPRIPVVVLRDGRRETIYITVDVRQGRGFRGYYPDDYRNYPWDRDRAWLGVYLDTRYPDHAVVEAVQIGSAADRAGLRAGDWILAINGQPIEGPTHLSRMVRSMDPGEEIQMEVSRRVTRDVYTRLGERPDSRGRFQYYEEEPDGFGMRIEADDRTVREQRGYRGQRGQRGLFGGDGLFNNR